MAIYTSRPAPVPTPFQKIQYGGNPYLSQSPKNQVLGESISNKAVPVKSSKGVVTFSNNVQVPQKSVVPAPTSWQSMAGYTGWDPAAAAADYAATGGAGKGGGGNSGGDSGGGGGSTYNKYASSTGDVRADQVIADPTATADFEASGLNMDEYLSSIDQEAASQNAMLGGYETSANADKLATEQNLQGQATQLKGTALAGKEDALSAARRLYSELQQGYKQRFGGASSAGEAAMALTGNEQQRQMAQTNRGYQDTVNQIDQQAATALNTVQSEFRARIDQINQNRTLVESQRLLARRSALQDLANKAFAIKQQQESFKQNLQLMQAQIDMQAKANGAQAFNINPTSTLTTTNKPVTASGNTGLDTAVGSINNTSSGMYNDPYLNSLFKQNPFNTGASYIK